MSTSNLSQLGFFDEHLFAISCSKNSFLALGRDEKRDVVYSYVYVYLHTSKSNFLGGNATLSNSVSLFFIIGALFRGKGGPPVLEEPARYRPYLGHFFSILLTHEGSQREVYRDFQPSLTSSAGGAKG